MAIYFSYPYENGKRSDQKTNPKLTKVDHSGRFQPGQEAFFRSYLNFKVRARRPKAFRFYFHKSIDRNQNFHCARGWSEKSLLQVKYKPFGRMVDKKMVVPGDPVSF